MVQLLQVFLLFFIGISFSHVSSEYEDRIINESEEFNSVFSPSPFHGCSNDSYPPTFRQHIQEYIIDLDKPPEERWVHLVTDKKEELKKLFWMMKNNTAEIFGGEIIKLINTYLPWLTNTLPKEYYNELIGVSSASGIPVGEVTIFNIFYELYSACTSIIMQSSNKHIYLGRNLDFGLLLGWDFKNGTWMATEYLRPLVVKTIFKKENRIIYRSVGFVGYIGVLTAVKKDAFALTVNERFNLDGGYIGLLEWILGRRNQRWIGLLTRDVLENSENYLQAQKFLSSPTLIAPVYFILAGRKSHQGCVITRGRTDYDVWSLENYNDKNKWFLVQTNYDHWKTPPFYDNRRDPANKCMEQFGSDYPEATLYKVLSTRPVLNKLTTFTAIMDVTTGDVQAWIRNCKSPCWPW